MSDAHAIDGSDLILGRASSRIAKRLLQGENIHVVHADKMVVLGNPSDIVEHYLQRRRAQHKGTPEFSPVWSRVPHYLVRRIVRGMLPWDRARGRIAYKRLRVSSGNPGNLPAVSIEQAKCTKKVRHITIYQLCKQLGYTR